MFLWAPHHSFLYVNGHVLQLNGNIWAIGMKNVVISEKKNYVHVSLELDLFEKIC